MTANTSASPKAVVLDGLMINFTTFYLIVPMLETQKQLYITIQRSILISYH